MQIVIDIPDRMWERVKEGYVPLGISKHLKKGTPLSKGHGRLIDADDLRLDTEWDDYYDGFTSYSEMQIRDAETIIDADKEEKE